MNKREQIWSLRRIKMRKSFLTLLLVATIFCGGCNACAANENNGIDLTGYELLDKGTITSASFACSCARDFHSFGIIQFDGERNIIVTADSHDFVNDSGERAWDSIGIGKEYALYGRNRHLAVNPGCPMNEFVLVEFDE